MSVKSERALDQAHDWLIEWVCRHDQDAEAHYRHIQEGEQDNCTQEDGATPCTYRGKS